MWTWAAAVVCLCLLFKAYKERKRMGSFSVIYLIILVIDLLVGGSLVLWKCVLRDNAEECRLAQGGAVGSLVIWVVLMSLCPLFMTRWNICEIVQNIRDTVKYYLEIIHPPKNHHFVLDTELFLPSKPSFKYNKDYKVILDENRNGVHIGNADISIIPSGKGTVRGNQDIVFTSQNSQSHDEVKVKFTEIDET